MKNPSRRQRATRWGLLAVPIVLGLVLIASSIHNHLSATRLVDALTQGQGEGFARDIRTVARPELGPPRDEQLAEALAQRQAWGLRAIVVLDPHGIVLARAGESLVGPSHPVPKPGQLQRVGDRVRWLVPPPPLPPRPPRPPASSQPSPNLGAFPPTPPFPEIPPPPGASDPLDRLPGHALLLEFEPLPALALVERSRTNVLLNIVAALVLMVVAVVLWRASARAQEAEASLARQQHLAALGEMSAVLAHEIRNPLATVKGHAQLIAERVKHDDLQRRWADVMVDHVLRLERLVHQLLDFSRTREVRRQPVNPADLIDEAGYEVDRDRIDLDVGRAPATWRLDPERMNQVFVNVLRNALQASPDQERVEVAVFEQASRLVVTVRDRGEGIPEGQEQSIFEPFHTKRVRGTGLGLTVAKRIVELHGGSIEASNHPEGGAVFCIALPQG